MSRNSIGLRVMLTLCLLAGFPLRDASAGGKTITFYLDGTRVEQDLAIENFVAELPLPASMQPGSLRVKPLGATRVSRVEVVPVKPGGSVAREIARLEGRREELRDRLKALGVKEEIYKSAAKSQGSKSPRRTRTNPEPLSSLRQGTDFAISRLEEVYRATRKTEREMQEIERKQSSLRRSGGAGAHVKIRIDGKRGTLRLSYLTTGAGWVPFYDMRFSGGFADVTLRGRIPEAGKGVVHQVVPAPVAGPDRQPSPVTRGSEVTVATYRLPILSERRLQTLQNSVAVTLKNDSGFILPPGDAAGFWQEEFLGQTGFTGLDTAETGELVFGIPEAGDSAGTAK